MHEYVIREQPASDNRIVVAPRENDATLDMNPTADATTFGNPHGAELVDASTENDEPEPAHPGEPLSPPERQPAPDGDRQESSEQTREDEQAAAQTRDVVEEENSSKDAVHRALGEQALCDEPEPAETSSPEVGTIETPALPGSDESDAPTKLRDDGHKPAHPEDKSGLEEARAPLADEPADARAAPATDAVIPKEQESPKDHVTSTDSLDKPTELRGEEVENDTSEGDVGMVIGPGNGYGIPAYVFNQGYDGTFTTAAANELSGVVSDNWVEITDGSSETGSPSDADYHFIACLYSHDGSNSLGLSVRTVYNGERHPDMYMAPLVAKTIDYFEARLGPGERIPYIWGNWSDEPRADNWNQYRAYLKVQGPGPYSPEQKAAAAASTKTGTIAAKNGFTVIDGNEIEESSMSNHVTVRFRRTEVDRPKV